MNEEYVVYIKTERDVLRVKGFDNLGEAEELADSIFRLHLLLPTSRFIKIKPDGSEYTKYIPVRLIDELGVTKIKIME